MKTRKKLLSLLLTLFLIAGLLPASAFAAESEESRYSTDGGHTWTEASLVDAIFACYLSKDSQIELLRDVTLTPDNWTVGIPLAYTDSSLTLDGRGFTLKRGKGIAKLCSVNEPGSVVTLKNITVDGGAVWSSDDPASRTNSGLSVTGNAHLFDVDNGGTLILDSGAVLQNSHISSTSLYGAAVSVASTGSGTLEMKDGAQIKDNTVYCGAVYLWDGGTFLMSGGKISGNYASNNGGAVCMGGGTFTMTGGEISANKALAGGGGVSVFQNSAVFTMEGGSIKNNSISKTMGGGILVYNGSMTVSGTPIIAENTGNNGEKPNNTYLNNGKVISIKGALTDGASIGVTTAAVPGASPVFVTTSNNADYSDYFKSDALYDVVNSVNNVVLLQGHTDHHWSAEWTYDTDHHWHDCIKDGCSITDNSKKDGYDAHTYDQKVVSDDYKVSAADCTAPASYHYSCICGVKGTETFTDGEASGHHGGAAWESDTLSHWHKCTVCGDIFDKSAHTEDNGTTTKLPTEVSTGVRTFKCTVCKKVLRTETIAKLPIIEQVTLAWVKVGTNQSTVTWNKVKGASGYEIYAAQCNTSNKQYKLTKVKEIKSGSTLSCTVTKLKKSTWYKYQVKAYKMVQGKKVIIGKSLIMHAITAGNKTYGNPAKVTVSFSTVSIKPNATKKITYNVTISNNKKYKKHVDVRYVISDKSIVSVSSTGVIKGLKKGSCTVWAVAQNGTRKAIKVTVK